MNKIEKLMQHVGWEQVSDTHAIDVEMGDMLSTGNTLAYLLLENAQNQTGISLNNKEEKEILTEIKSKYC